MNTITFINLPLNQIRRKEVNSRALVKLINNNKHNSVFEPANLNSSKSNLTFHLDKELSCRNFVILNHYRRESVIHHLKHARGQARNLFLQVRLFGQEV